MVGYTHILFFFLFGPTYMFICFQLKLVVNISKTWTFSLKYDFWLLLGKNGNVGPLGNYISGS